VETTVPAIPLNIFVPDDNAESFSTIPTVIDLLDANLILSLLTEYSMLDEGIMLNSIELTGTQLNLDFNQAFLDQLCTYGTTGERMMIGCVVNTFLSAYDAETVYITVNGEIMESGHVIYDFPLEFYN
jgi:spore germination protein GerM